MSIDVLQAKIQKTKKPQHDLYLLRPFSSFRMPIKDDCPGADMAHTLRAAAESLPARSHSVFWTR